MAGWIGLSFRLWPRILLPIAICLSVPVLFPYGQEKSVPAGDDGAAARAAGKKTIRVNVEEVRIDAVVVDGGWRQVTDLTSDEFEIYQDGVLQEITSCTYIRDYEERPRIGPPPSTTVSARKHVGRTIAFVVDNLSFDLASAHRARTALRKFVETQMQPGDQVAIFQTSAEDARSMVFTSDRRHLLARIDAIRFFLDSRTVFNVGSFPVIRFYTRVMRDMPGRKHILWLTTNNYLPEGYHPVSDGDGESVEARAERLGISVESLKNHRDYLSPDAPFVTEYFDNVANEALRASVVIHTLDTGGLTTPLSNNLTMETFYSGDLRRRHGRIPLSEKTGGIFMEGYNWFLNGIGDDVQEAINGYYLLTYAPPPGTFGPDVRGEYRRVEVKSKRRRTEVRHRDGFLGETDSPEDSTLFRNPLMKAIFSPFQYNDLTVNLAAGYIRDPEEGYLIRAWVHLDGRQLGIVEDANGENFFVLETLGARADINGLAWDSGNVPYRIPVNNEEILWVREHGLRFSITIPSKAPGSYYVRIAVKDAGSGRIGSAYRYVEIPDLEKGRLGLSDLFVVDSREDAQRILQGTAQEVRSEAESIPRDIKRSPAVRRYQQGESFEYMVVAYNAVALDSRKPELEVSVVLYRDGVEVFRSEPEEADLYGVSDYQRIPIRNRISLDETLQPGNYVLRLHVLDRQAGKEQRTASAALDFTVVPKREPTDLEKAEEWVRRGNEAVDAGRKEAAARAFGEAAGLYRRELARASWDVVLWKHAGFVSSLADQRDHAVAAYGKALELKPDDVESHYMLGIIHLPFDADAAVPEFREAIRLRPGRAKHYLGLGRALARIHKYDDAISALEEACRLDPEDGECHAALGIARQNSGGLKEAVEEYRKALALNLSHESADDVRRLLRNVLAALKNEGEKSGDIKALREYYIDRIKQYRAAMDRHVPGVPDKAAIEIGSWPVSDMVLIINLICRGQDYTILPVFDIVFGGPYRIARDVLPLLRIPDDPNPFLKQAALLHTDIAIFRLDTGKVGGRYSSSGIRVRDGVGNMENTDPRNWHWLFAGRPLDKVSPRPLKDRLGRQWYTTTSAVMLARRNFDYAREHLASARKLFRTDPRILFYSGILHENYAAPGAQNALDPDGRKYDIESMESELKKARKYFRDAVRADPGFAEARLHLGRVTGLLGDHEEAVEELREASADLTDQRLRYYCALYLGNELAALHRSEEARQQYETAVGLYPGAQSPLLSLSSLAREHGDYPDAMAHVKEIFASTTDHVEPADPWWDYDVSSVRDVSTLVSRLYETWSR